MRIRLMMLGLCRRVKQHGELSWERRAALNIAQALEYCTMKGPALYHDLNAYRQQQQEAQGSVVLITTQYRRLARRMDAMHDIHSRFAHDLTQALGTAFRATGVDIQWPVFGEDSVYPPPDTPDTLPLEGDDPGSE
ncbi:hypothetical protein AgCh_017884 [Apium graveolens]